MASLQCINPQIIRPKTVSNKRLKFDRKISVPCGKCGSCLRRKSRCMAGKVLMELSWTSVHYEAEGFVWLLTLTYDKAKCSHYWVEPESHDLAEMWEPYMVNKGTLSRAELREEETRHIEDRRTDVYWYLRRNGHSQKQINAYEAGEYPRAKTLVRRDVKLWLLRCRKELGYQPRIAYSGEYGDGETKAGTWLPPHIEEGNRPHYHIVVMGAPRSDIEKMARQWKHGNVDPNPYTPEGRQGFDRQQNEAGNASGKIAGYLAGHTQAKLARSTTRLSGRAEEFTQGSKSPALGDRYIESNFAPFYSEAVARMLEGNFDSPGELLLAERKAAWWVTQQIRWIKLQGGAYPLTERHKQFIRDACKGISPEAWDYCKLVALQPLEVQAAIQSSDDAGAKDDWKKEIDSRKDELKKREERKSRGRHSGRTHGTRKRIRRAS